MQLSIFKVEDLYISCFNGRLYSHCGDDSVEDPPVLIPNTEVKLNRAESTCPATGREDRLLPHSIKKERSNERSFLMYMINNFSLGSKSGKLKKGSRNIEDILGRRSNRLTILAVFRKING